MPPIFEKLHNSGCVTYNLVYVSIIGKLAFTGLTVFLVNDHQFWIEGQMLLDHIY